MSGVVISPAGIPEELLKKYGRSGPRYTSYPTAPQFVSDIDIKTYGQYWAETNNQSGDLSMYGHFPFCQTRCYYCGCYTNTGKSSETVDRYLHALSGELEMIFHIIDPSRKVHQLALGGGTPAYLSQDQMKFFMATVMGFVQFAPDAERSIEIDPRRINVEYLDLLVSLGFNRFSFGIQDLDPQVQKNINRILDERHLGTLTECIRKRNINAINFDLIYGLPGQSVESFSNTIDKIVILRPSRVALFGYAHVPWVSPHQKILETFQLPSPGERMQLFGAAFEKLLDAGYEHVGMDHFALPDDELIIALKKRSLTRNFMGYTTKRGLDLVGIGASSISSVGKTYVQNVKNLEDYCRNRNTLHWVKGIVLSEEDLLRREIIIELFCNFYLDIPAIEDRFNLKFPEHFAAELKSLEYFVKDGLLEIHESALKVTELGRFFIRNICMIFDEYLDVSNSRIQYSKTI